MASQKVVLQFKAVHTKQRRRPKGTKDVGSTFPPLAIGQLHVQGGTDHASIESGNVSGITYNIENFTNNVFHTSRDGLPATDSPSPLNNEHPMTSTPQFRHETSNPTHSNQVFNKACLEGKNSRVKQLISKGGVDINNISPGGWTPVMTAVCRGHTPVLNTLLKEQCDLSLVLDNGDNILHVACSGSSFAIVKRLVSNDEISLEKKDILGRTPLMKAASTGNEKVFDLLVKEGCNLSAMDYEGNNMLHSACSGGSVHIVRYLLQQKVADIESGGEDGMTPVMVASKNGHKEVFDLLRGKGCNLAVVDELDNSILHAACCSHSVYIVGYLLSNRIIDIERRGEDGLTPVMVAAMKGQTEVFDELVRNRCDLSVVDDLGDNILHAACYSDNVSIVRDILSRKLVDINSKDYDGNTPLMVAAQKGNKKVFDLLVSNECDEFDVSDSGGNILHAACLSNDAVLVKEILLRGVADIESRDEDGATPVMLAAAQGHKEVFDLLVNQGCNLNVRNSDNHNILHAACSSDNAQIVEDILSRKIDHINSRTSNGLTAVMVAAANGQKKVYDLLARKGCDLSVVDYMGDNILHAACASDNVNFVNCILSRDLADIESRGENRLTPVMFAAVSGQRKVFDLLVRKGCDLSVTSDQGNNILHAGSLGGNVSIVEYILSCDYLLGRNMVDIDSRNETGLTPVMAAAMNGKRKVFDLLVRKHCNMSMVHDSGTNILHFACFSDNVQIVENILSHHIADINSINEDGLTPVMIAASQGQKKVFDLLCVKGCDLKVTDHKDRTILHAACCGDNVQIVEHLLLHKIADINSRDENGLTPVIVAAKVGENKVFNLLVNKQCDLSVLDNDNNNILHAASSGGSVWIVNCIISRNIADKESRGKNRVTPIMSAAENGHKNVFDFLVNKGCSLTTVDDSGRNILHCACVGGNVQIVENIISQGSVGLTSTDKERQTPIMVAAKNGHKNVFDLLVNKGSSLTTVDDSGRNILHCACVGGNVQIVENIISHGSVDMTSTDKEGQTPIMVAAKNGHKNVFDLLVKKGCSLTTVDDSGRNILHCACVDGNVQIIKYIISQGSVDLTSKDKEGQTPIMVAAKNGHKNVFDLLVNKGCSLTTVDDSGRNILHCACVGCNVLIVMYIISHGSVDLTSTDKEGQTPIMVAAKNGHKNVFDLLVNKRCSLTTVDDSGRNILHCACVGGNVQIVEYIISYGSVDMTSTDKEGQTPIMVAAKNGHKNVFDLLVDKGCSLTTVDDSGRNILHCACVGGNVQIVEYIISHGSVDMTSTDKEGQTPIMVAAKNGHKNVFDLLVDKRCSLTTVDDSGRNILHCACVGGNVQIVECIISHGSVDLTSTDKEGQTPIMVAAKNGHKNVFDLLVNKGCSLTTVDNSGRNILHCARVGGNVQIVEYIISHDSVDDEEGRNRRIAPKCCLC
ncbi:serine/threonine-protein phosphatase 6 regulatory ankyrin repeat subunit A-like [Haliotis cracherodii]|uniref:serine/threonine-protein phosphatase 6 regulatory ankyrin repeat subunit A-like n=1 Tax=Haliotis cracherodii TaxID=6455 RepID=UPI0039EB30FE